MTRYFTSSLATGIVSFFLALFVLAWFEAFLMRQGLPPLGWPRWVLLPSLHAIGFWCLNWITERH